MVRPIARPRPGSFFPTRARGQCFLKDPSFIERIVTAIGPKPGELLIELGAGAGELSLPLADAGSRVLAVESDRRLVELLKKRLSSTPSLDVTLHPADALELDLKGLLAGRGADPVRVCGNLPYSVASAILLKLLEQPDSWSELVLMFQDEVASRLVAQPRTKAYGFLTVITQQLAIPEVLFRIPPAAFRPRPRVVSALVRLRPRPEPPSVGSPPVYRRLVKGLLAHRRKTIANNIRALPGTGDLPPSQESIRSGLRFLSIDDARRAETLTVEEFAALSQFCFSHA